MTKKKIFIMAISLILVCAATFAGTLAYLTATAPMVKNTFTAQSGLADTFKLEESKATLSADGTTYTLDTATKVTSNTYASVLAGMTIAKDPTLTLKLKANTTAYVYVEVVDTTAASLLFSLNTTALSELTGVTGPNGGNVYLVKNDTGDTWTGAATGNTINALPLILNDRVTVGALANGASDLGALSFYGYACQSTGFASASTAFTTCFPANK